MNELPGNTQLCSNKTELFPLLSSKRPIIILATNHVRPDTLFLNGLTQNVLILYHLFESIGYECYLLEPSLSNLSTYRLIQARDMIARQMSIHAFIEIGMSIDPLTRQYLRSIHAKIIKLYLGNILNIDIETIQNYSQIHFSHHVVGEIDEIWTSPHYSQHLEYATLLNRLPLSNGRIVPYVWDPCFLSQYGSATTMNWMPSDWKKMNIVIMDANISFQKFAFYSLLLCQAFADQYPEWTGKVHVVNGDRFKLNSHMLNNVLPFISLYRNGRILLQGRQTIHAILENNPSACFITHQWNNDYNYATLELMYCQYPVVHNSVGWSEYGYYYSLDEWEKAIDVLANAMKHHASNRYNYQSHASQLIWKHSIHHPEVQKEWKQIID